MNPFKGRHFQRDIILWAVRWYCKYGISYRELQEMLAERGVNVDHSTIYRWVQRYAPEMEKRLRWYWRNPSDLCPWHMDETYVKVNGRWAYLYRAVDSRGRTVDFYLSSRRNSKAAYRFLGKILNNVKKWQIPRFINTDKAPAYGRALALLKREGRCPSDVEHRQIKYRNNVIECDHGKLKRIIGATLGFKSMKTAYATIKGIEVMRALRKGQASAFYYGDPLGEMRLVAGARLNLLRGVVAAARDVEQIDPALRQQRRQTHRVILGPGFGEGGAVVLEPVRGADTQKERHGVWDGGAHEMDDLERQANAVLEGTAVFVRALVGDR